MSFPAEIRLPQRLANNERVVRSFQGGSQVRRQLKPRSATRVRLTVHGVVLRLSFDLVAAENGDPRQIFYNFRAVPLDPDIARLTIELSHWVLEKVGQTPPIRSIEYVDLHSGHVHTFGRRRERGVRLGCLTSESVGQDQA